MRDQVCSCNLSIGGKLRNHQAQHCLAEFCNPVSAAFYARKLVCANQGGQAGVMQLLYQPDRYTFLRRKGNWS